MSILDKKTSGDLVKLVIFIVVTTLATGVLVVLIGNVSFTSTRDYKAVFSDATGVVKGDDIRIAGVKVGSVKDVEVVDRNRALVHFDVANSSIVTKSSTATVRYRNLVGQRYIQLTQGVGDLGRLPKDSTIPMERTQPALDLTVLFNGFKPLFKALSPADVNKLSAEVISVFQGEGGNLNALLQSTASLTNTLADRDQVIGDMITNLNDVLATLAGRDKQLSELIVSPEVHGRAGQGQGRHPGLAGVSVRPGGRDVRARRRDPALVRARRQGLRQAAGNLNKGRDEVDRALQVLPLKLKKIGRTAINGSFFNFYLCQFQGNVWSAEDSRSSTTPAPSARMRGAISDETPFRERNPVPIGAISIAAISLLIGRAFKAGDLPLIGGGDTTTPPSGVRWPQAQRRGPHRRRQGRQGNRRRARRRQGGRRPSRSTVVEVRHRNRAAIKVKTLLGAMFVA